ncbi:MAG: hypothetical protein IJK56_02910 [Firmicutes bacterium]|nr:hypothetical protein [Bacillota bacterium]
MENKALRALMDEWKEEHYKKGYDHFIYDGCADYDTYINTPYRILIVGKEAYVTDDDPKNDPRFVRKEGDKLTWYWTDSIQDAAPRPKHSTYMGFCVGILDKMAEERLIPKKKYSYKNVALLDLKKSRDPADPDSPKKGDSNTKDIRTIIRFAEEDREWIRKEIALLQPDLIIFHGTYQCADIVLGKDKRIIHNYEEEQPAKKNRGMRALYEYNVDYTDNPSTVKVLDMYHLSADRFHSSDWRSSRTEQIVDALTK